MLQRFRQISQFWCNAIPVIKRRLKGRHHRKGIRRPGEVFRDDHQATITTMFERSQFHLFSIPFKRAR
jgi:hypothetical protein